MSEDGSELPPYTEISVTRKSKGKKMIVEAPKSVGYGSSFAIKVKDENGNYVDHVNVIFGNLQYRNIYGELKLTPADKGTYNLEIRRPGYVPFKTSITVGEDYTIIIVMFILVLVLISVFYIFYKKWMEE